MAFVDDWTNQKSPVAGLYSAFILCPMPGVSAFLRAWSSDCCLSLGPKWKALDAMGLTLFTNPALVASARVGSALWAMDGDILLCPVLVPCCP